MLLKQVDDERRQATPPTEIRNHQTHRNLPLPGRRQQLFLLPLLFPLQQKRAHAEREKNPVCDQRHREPKLDEGDSGEAFVAIKDRAPNESERDPRPDHGFGDLVRSCRCFRPICRCSAKEPVQVDDRDRAKPDYKPREQQKQPKEIQRIN